VGREMTNPKTLEKFISKLGYSFADMGLLTFAMPASMSKMIMSI
jgi:hypothetical protein